MKRFAFCVLALMAVAMGWSQTLTLMGNGIVKFAAGEDQFRGAPGAIEKIANDFMVKHPGVKVNFVYRDVSKGSLTFDAMLAAGNPPDIWIDAGSYMPNYLNDNYALRLEQYLDLREYQQNLIDLWTRNGHVYAIPLVNIATGMAVNLDMLKKVDYTLPPVAQWTTTEFLSLAAKLKAVGIPATMIMGKGGLNGWTDVWLYAFGAAMFKPGDYSKVTINTPQALAALDFIRTVVDKGYTPPALEVNDDDGVEMFTTEKVWSCMMQNGHTDPTIPEQVRQGKIPRVFDYTFIEFPHAPGLSHAPVYAYQTVAIAHKSKSEATNKLIAELTGMVTGREAQWYYATLSGGFPTIKGFAPDQGMAALPTYKAIAELARTAGVYQEWPLGPQGQEIRRIWYTYSEQWLRGRIDSRALLSRFEADANKVLNK